MFCITSISQKGGVGKTTNSIMIANNLAARNYKVLVIDLDINNSASLYYTANLENVEDVYSKNIFEALTHRSCLDYIIKSNTNNIDILVSSLNLVDIRTIDYHVLKKIIPTEGYDYVIIDTAPTYDNHVQSSIFASDLILTPLSFDMFNITTTRFLRTKLYDEFPEQVEKWFLLYSHWQEKLANFPSSLQSQFASLYESEFDNILDVKIPFTPSAVKYTCCNEKLKSDSSIVGVRRLAQAYNALVNMITNTQDSVAIF